MPAHKYTPEERISVFWSRVDKSSGDDACWNWTAGFSSRKYGTFFFDGRSQSTHRVAWQLTYGAIPEGLCVCHSCDNQACCNPSHLWLGTFADNNQDRHVKGRDAKGERNGNYTHPERRAVGERNGRHTHPERGARGDRHWTRSKPERIVRAFGERNGSNTHPEKLPRGEHHKNSKLTDAQVLEIRCLYAQGGITLYDLAVRFAVSQSTIQQVTSRKRRTTNNT